MSEIIGVTKPTGPKCPSCSTRPVTYAESPLKFPNGAVYSQVICNDCGHVFGLAFIGMAQQSQIQAVPAMPKIMRN